MGIIRAVVQDENGRDQSEGIDFPSSILPSQDDTRFICLRFVDPYGDTIFNHLQTPVVLEELSRLHELVRNDDYQAIIRKLKSLGEMCQTETHLYLKFIGD